MDQKTLEYELEELVDATSIRVTLEALATICRGKAEHLRANWQDNKSARVWEQAAGRIDKAAERVSANL